MEFKTKFEGKVKTITSMSASFSSVEWKLGSVVFESDSESHQWHAKLYLSANPSQVEEQRKITKSNISLKSDRLIIYGLNGNENGIHLKLFNKQAEARQLVDRIVKESKQMEELKGTCLFAAEHFHPDLAIAFLKNLREHSKSSNLTDVTIEVDGKIFNSYKFILSSCSGFFCGLFSSDMKENKENHVTLKNISSKIFKLILDSLFENKDIVNKDTLIEIWKAADMLQILPLVSLCEVFAVGNLETHDVVSIYNTSLLLSSESVQTASWSFILEHFEELFDSEKQYLLNFSLEDLKLLISDDKLKIKTEDNVIKLVFEWTAYTEEISNAVNTHATKLPEEELHSDEGLYIDKLFQQQDNETSKNTLIATHTQTEQHIMYPRSIFLLELVGLCRLILVSDKCLLRLISFSTLVDMIPNVKNLFVQCMQWKTDGYIMNSSSLEMSYFRDCSEKKNIVGFISNSLGVRFYDYFENSSKHFIKYSLTIQNEMEVTLVAACVWNHNIFFISKEFDLYAYSLLSDFGYKLIYKNIVDGPEIAIIGGNNCVTIIGKDVKESKSLFVDNLTVKLMSAADLPVSVDNIHLAYMRSYLLVFGCENKTEVDNTCIQCIDTSSNDIYCIGDVIGVCKNMTTFQTLENTYFLFGNGHLWKLEENISTEKLNSSFVTILWDKDENENYKLYSAVLIRSQLWIYYSGPAKTLIPGDASLEKVFTKVKKFGLKFEYAPYHYFSTIIPRCLFKQMDKCE